MSDRKYKIEVSEEQLEVINTALEVFFRLRIGQVDMIPWKIFPDKVTTVDRELADSFLDRAFYIYRQKTGASSSDFEMQGGFDVACDLHQVFRHRLMWDRKPEGPDGYNTWFNEPLLRTSPPPFIELVKS